MMRTEKIGFYSIGGQCFAGGLKVSEWLLEKAVDTVYSPKGFKEKCPDYVFFDAGVDVMPTGNKNLAAIQRHIQRKSVLKNYPKR